MIGKRKLFALEQGLRSFPVHRDAVVAGLNLAQRVIDAAIAQKDAGVPRAVAVM